MTLAFNSAGNVPGFFKPNDCAMLIKDSAAGALYSLQDHNGTPGSLMSILVAKPEGLQRSDKLAFIHHGRNGNAEGMRDIASAYLAHGYMVVMANARNSHYNDSAGTAKDFTITEHINDLERTIEFAHHNSKAIGWTGDIFALAGFSMGGYAASYLAATRYSGRAAHLLALSPLTTGERQIEARRDHPKGIEILQRELPLAMDEWPKHDIFKHISGLTSPVSVIVGADDTVTPPRHVCAFADALKHQGVLVSLDVLDGRHHSVLNQTGDDFSTLVFKRVEQLERARLVRPRPAPDVSGHAPS